MYEDYEVDQEQLDREKRYHEANEVITNMGYDFVQEAIVDLMTEGYYNKDDGEWVEITDPSDIKTTRVHMNLAQAKHYGLKIIRAEPE